MSAPDNTANAVASALYATEIRLMTHPDDQIEPQGSDASAEQPETAPENIESSIEEADERVADLERRLAEQHDKYLRLAAEYDNYRKRTSRERAETQSRAQGELIKHLLESLDDLARFAHLDPASVDSKTVVHGVELVEKKLLKALASEGLEIVNPVNQSFDPTLHEAVATEPALAPEDDDVVARVYQLGYLFNGQLLRAARVVVKQWNG